MFYHIEDVSNFFLVYKLLPLEIAEAYIVVNTLAIYLVSRIPRLHLTFFAAIIVHLTTAAS